MPHRFDGNFPEGACKAKLSDSREMKHCHRCLKTLPPISLTPFVGWPIPARRFLMKFVTCSRQSISRFSLEPGFFNWRAWEVCKGCASMAATYCWKVLNVLFLSFVDLLSSHCKSHNQNKADSTMNKNQDLFKLTGSKLDLWVKNALCFDGVLSAWFHFQRQCEFRRRTISCATIRQ